MDELNFLRRSETLVVPSKLEHKQTFIMLHGRGDRADSFGAGILVTSLPDGSDLRLQFPNAKFVFLQAPLRQLAAIPTMKYNQWFDVWGLRPGQEEDDLQIEGLRETVQLVHGTLYQEIESVGAHNVVLGGLSQGCASSLISLLLWDGPPFAACIGMCGWLPFRKLLEETLMKAENEGIAGSELQQRAVATLATKMCYAESYVAPTTFQKIPVFLGHGTYDNVVVPRLGKEAATCVGFLKSKVVYKEYQSLAHWYSPLMLGDIVQFLRAETGWTSV